MASAIIGASSLSNYGHDSLGSTGFSRHMRMVAIDGVANLAWSVAFTEPPVSRESILWDNLCHYWDTIGTKELSGPSPAVSKAAPRYCIE